MNLQSHRKFLHDLQSVWEAYKVGGKLDVRVTFSLDGSIEWAAPLGVRKRKYNCITWIYGSTPNELFKNLVAWIERDRHKHSHV